MPVCHLNSKELIIDHTIFQIRNINNETYCVIFVFSNNKLSANYKTTIRYIGVNNININFYKSNTEIPSLF